ncbi:hypothetical protein J3Q64DRAFT_1819339 [Phycomyces blakesleeanus]|uniref:Matrin-type domain-containing protein n=2 Tax=Phycomyces blakesleeanus TaxID=4837 RepID=A0A162YGS8_PHYB8|nr:hypothetical protein PHYBLDRAFT_184357 [Phycomyces blakesleeanus NRRL 1555(-)]OAD80565.1 hypothetical protein PHYBLDRAFT_184357 [Phycomyces blakesleeanus NRRL 1555(-)]|eukprot:XP_018298605.1 hypothetical protein PHYBLDRAFT_184357 [Phycomyces blakesleeanus NRRL 1555(-)]
MIYVTGNLLSSIPIIDLSSELTSFINIFCVRADYWVSQQRHWCKYCKKFIANNKPSIQIHETGLAHKNQVENFLRDVYKRGKEEKKQSESVRRELQRIEKAALLSYNGKDTGNVPLQASPAPAVRSGIEAYGIGEYGSGLYGSDAFARSEGKMPVPEHPNVDKEPVDEVVLQGREEWAVRSAIALAGEWETVVPKPTSAPQNTSETSASALKKEDPTRPEEEEEEDEEDLRNFKIKEKEYPVTITSLDETVEVEEMVFKKRKNTASTVKKRNIRRKTDTQDYD